MNENSGVKMGLLPCCAVEDSHRRERDVRHLQGLQVFGKDLAYKEVLVARRELRHRPLLKHLKAPVSEFEERDTVFVGGDEIWKHGLRPNVRHERRAKGREAAFGTSARW